MKSLAISMDGLVATCRPLAWILLWACAWVSMDARAEGCQVAYFKAQAMAIHNTQERITMTHDWLKDNIPECSASQLKTILGSSPIWLGTALTPKIAGLLEAAIEAKSSEDSAEAVEKLLKPPARKSEEALTEVHSAGTRGARNLTKPGSVTAVDNTALMSQAAQVAAAAATAAAIVQGQAQPGAPVVPQVKTHP